MDTGDRKSARLVNTPERGAWESVARGPGQLGLLLGPLTDKTARGNPTLSPWIKAVCLFLGPSVHTCRVIRPNYEREVRFPFMLLNQSRSRSPAISQRRQGAGDLQIKRGHHLPVTHTHPWTRCLASHTRASGGRVGKSRSLSYEASKLVEREGWGQSCQIPLLML